MNATLQGRYWILNSCSPSRLVEHLADLKSRSERYNIPQREEKIDLIYGKFMGYDDMNEAIRLFKALDIEIQAEENSNK